MMGRSNLHVLLRPVKRRLQFIQMVKGALYGALFGMLAACLLLFIARFYPTLHASWWALALVGCGIVGGILFALSQRVTELQAARVMDDHGLNDHMTTALSFQHMDSKIVRLQRQQAIDVAYAFIPQMKQTIAVPRMHRSLVASSVLGIILMLLILWPNPLESIAIERAAEATWVAQQVEEIIAMQETLTEEDDEVQQSVADMLAQLQAELAEHKRAFDALEAMAQTLQQLDELKNEASANRGTTGADETDVSPSIDMDALEQLVTQTQHQLAQLGGPMAEQLAAQGVDLPQGWQTDGLAADLLLEAMLAAAENGSVGGSEGQAGSGSGQGDGVGGSDQVAGSGNMGDGNGQSDGQTSGQVASGDGLANGGAPGSGDGSNGADGSDGAGDGAGSGSGLGSGSGSVGGGSGSGSVGGGNGAGSGSGAGSGAGSGSGAGTGEGSRHLVYTPRTLEGEGEQHVDLGPIEGTGGDIIHGGQSPVSSGASRPYEEVFAAYEAEAKVSLNRSLLPYHTQHLVREYFIEIQPTREIKGE